MCFLDLKAHPGSIFDGSGVQCIRGGLLQEGGGWGGGCSKKPELFIHLSRPAAHRPSANLITPLKNRGNCNFFTILIFFSRRMSFAPRETTLR